MDLYSAESRFSDSAALKEISHFSIAKVSSSQSWAGVSTIVLVSFLQTGREKNRADKIWAGSIDA